MTQLHNNRLPGKGRIFPNYKIPVEELAQREAEREKRYQKCRIIFEQISPELINDHYNWFIVIEANSADYFVDINQNDAVAKARQKYPVGRLAVFRLNETGACGRI